MQNVYFFNFNRQENAYFKAKYFIPTKSTWVYFTQIFMPIYVLCFTHYSDRFIVDITNVFKNWFNYPIFEPASFLIPFYNHIKPSVQYCPILLYNTKTQVCLFKILLDSLKFESVESFSNIWTNWASALPGSFSTASIPHERVYLFFSYNFSRCLSIFWVGFFFACLKLI